MLRRKEGVRPGGARRDGPGTGDAGGLFRMTAHGFCGGISRTEKKGNEGYREHSSKNF